MAAPIGRPSKMEQSVLEKIPELIKHGCSDNKMAQILGVDQSTIINWKKNNRAFLITYNLAKQIADGKVEASLYNRAIGMKVNEKRTTESDRGDSVTHIEREIPPDTEAAKYWLENRRPEAWRRSPETVINNVAAFHVEHSDGSAESVRVTQEVVDGHTTEAPPTPVTNLEK